MKRIALVLAIFFFSLSPFGQEQSSTDKERQAWINSHVDAISKEAKNLDQNVLRTALASYKNAFDAELVSSPILSIVDFTKVSGTRRLWVVDVNSNRVLFHELVSHGRNSGDRAVASRFSNKHGSLQSSLGLFLTGNSYIGKAFGPSLTLHGLDKELNGNALTRGIVVHGAAYVSEELARQRGHVGRSFGCFSVRRDIARTLINTIKNGTLIYAYHPKIFA